MAEAPQEVPRPTSALSLEVRGGVTVTSVNYLTFHRSPTGVVGGIVGLAGLAGIAFFFLRGRRGREDHNDILGPNPLAYNPAMGETMFEQPKLYNPADPSTFPTPVSGGDSSYSGGQTTNPFQPGRYNGAPEL